LGFPVCTLKVIKFVSY